MGWTYLERENRRGGAVNGLQLILPVGAIYLQPELTMIPEVVDVRDEIEKTSLSSLELPVLLRIPLKLAGPDWLTLTMTAGPRLVFRFSGSSGQQNLEWEDLHRWDLGAALGTELAARLGAASVFLEIRAAAGALPVARGFQARSAVTTATVGYRVTFPPRQRRTEETDGQPAS
jgi:hypothetical protein